MRGGSVKRLVRRLVILVVAVGVLPFALALVVPRVLSRTPEARRDVTLVQMRLMVSELERYRIDNSGRAPSTEQGLAALVREPTSPPIPKHWKGPYLEVLPRDAWGNPFGYAAVGEGEGFRVWSLGADGVEGGEGYAADLAAGQTDDESGGPGGEGA